MQRITIWRRISQVAFFLFTGEWLAIGWLRCPFGVPFVNCLSCPLTDCPGRSLMAPFLVLIGLSSLLIGRGFCGWACPMGLVEDALSKLPKPRWTARPWFAHVDRLLKPLKYVFLAVAVFLVIRLNYPPERAHAYVVRNPSVFDVEAIRVAWSLGAHAYQVRALNLVAALLLTLLITRAWCRYFCPFGALFSLFNKVCLLALVRRQVRCAEGGKYPRECLQHTVPGTTDCVVCGDCIQGCPHGDIGFALRRTKKKAAEEPPVTRGAARDRATIETGG